MQSCHMLLRSGVFFARDGVSRRPSRVSTPAQLLPDRRRLERNAICYAPSRHLVRRSRATRRDCSCQTKAMATSVSSPSLPESKRDVQSRDLPGSPVECVLKLVAVACFSLALFQFLGAPSSFGRFACVAAQGAEKGVTSMPAWTGLSAGFLHTLAGPDHLAGLAPLTLGQKQTAAVSMGALWGFGHSSGQLLLGIIFLLLKERFQGIVPFLSKWAGTVVGLTLIAIGVMGIYESRFAPHAEHHDAQQTPGSRGGSIAKRTLGTYAIGFVYGLQPDALFVVLPALALPTRLATLSYVVMFVIGTVCAMAGYTFAIGTASEAAVERGPWLMQHLSTLAAAIALGVGFLILLPSLGCPVPFTL